MAPYDDLLAEYRAPVNCKNMCKAKFTVNVYMNQEKKALVLDFVTNSQFFQPFQTVSNAFVFDRHRESGFCIAVFSTILCQEKEVVASLADIQV